MSDVFEFSLNKTKQITFNLKSFKVRSWFSSFFSTFLRVFSKSPGCAPVASNISYTPLKLMQSVNFISMFGNTSSLNVFFFRFSNTLYLILCSSDCLPLWACFILSLSIFCFFVGNSYSLIQLLWRHS